MLSLCSFPMESPCLVQNLGRKKKPWLVFADLHDVQRVVTMKLSRSTTHSMSVPSVSE